MVKAFLLRRFIAVVPRRDSGTTAHLHSYMRALGLALRASATLARGLSV